MRTVLAVIGIAVAVMCIACGVGLYLFGRDSIEGIQAISQTGEQFLVAMQANDFKTASQLIAPTARSSYTETELRRRWQLLRDAIGTVQSWSIQRFNVHTDTAGSIGTLQMRVQGDRGSGTVDFTLKPEGNRWLIVELRFGW